MCQLMLTLAATLLQGNHRPATPSLRLLASVTKVQAFYSLCSKKSSLRRRLTARLPNLNLHVQPTVLHLPGSHHLGPHQRRPTMLVLVRYPQRHHLRHPSFDPVHLSHSPPKSNQSILLQISPLQLRHLNAPNSVKQMNTTLEPKKHA